MALFFGETHDRLILPTPFNDLTCNALSLPILRLAGQNFVLKLPQKPPLPPLPLRPLKFPTDSFHA
jgi:hypothetical protein